MTDCLTPPFVNIVFFIYILFFSYKDDSLGFSISIPIFRDQSQQFMSFMFHVHSQSVILSIVVFTRKNKIVLSCNDLSLWGCYLTVASRKMRCMTG